MNECIMAQCLLSHGIHGCTTLNKRGLVLIAIKKSSTSTTVNVEYLRSYKHQENDDNDVIQHSEKYTSSAAWTEVMWHCSLTNTIKAKHSWLNGTGLDTP